MSKTVYALYTRYNFCNFYITKHCAHYTQNIIVLVFSYQKQSPNYTRDKVFFRLSHYQKQYARYTPDKVFDVYALSKTLCALYTRYNFCRLSLIKINVRIIHVGTLNANKYGSNEIQSALKKLVKLQSQYSFDYMIVTTIVSSRKRRVQGQ